MKFLLQHPFFVLLVALHVALASALWWAVLRYVPEAVSGYTLHFSFAQGVETIGMRRDFFAIPAFVTGATLLNDIAALVLLRRIPALAYLFLWCTAFLAFVAGAVLWVLFGFNRLI